MENTKPLVTVIVAVYNIEKYIERCVDSLLKQTYQNLEIILVDDGSTDGSGNICDAYKEKDSRILVIHKKNGGLSDARNAGMEVATGEYIGYVDGDDWLEPRMYEKMVDACLLNEAQIAVCRYSQYLEIPVEDGTFRYEKQAVDEENTTDGIVVFDTEEALDHFICSYRKYNIHNCVWSKLFSREIGLKYRFPVGKNSEDIIYTTKTFCDADKITFVDTECYNYVVGRVGSIMNVSLFERRMAHEIPFFREQVAFLKEKNKAVLADKAAFYFYKRLLTYYREAKGQKDYAKKIAAELQNDRAEIKRIASADWAAKGDSVRMRLFLISPLCYECSCTLYERLVVPLKQKLLKLK